MPAWRHFEDPRGRLHSYVLENRGHLQYKREKDNFDHSKHVIKAIYEHKTLGCLHDQIEDLVFKLLTHLVLILWRWQLPQP